MLLDAFKNWSEKTCPERAKAIVSFTLQLLGILFAFMMVVWLLQTNRRLARNYPLVSNTPVWGYLNNECSGDAWEGFPRGGHFRRVDQNSEQQDCILVHSSGLFGSGVFGKEVYISGESFGLSTMPEEEIPTEEESDGDEATETPEEPESQDEKVEPETDEETTEDGNTPTDNGEVEEAEREQEVDYGRLQNFSIRAINVSCPDGGGLITYEVMLARQDNIFDNFDFDVEVWTLVSQGFFNGSQVVTVKSSANVAGYLVGIKDGEPISAMWLEINEPVGHDCNTNAVDATVDYVNVTISETIGLEVLVNESGGAVLYPGNMALIDVTTVHLLACNIYNHPGKMLIHHPTFKGAYWVADMNRSSVTSEMCAMVSGNTINFGVEWKLHYLEMPEPINTVVGIGPVVEHPSRGFRVYEQPDGSSRYLGNVEQGVRIELTGNVIVDQSGIWLSIRQHQRGLTGWIRTYEWNATADIQNWHPINIWWFYFGGEKS